MLAKDLKPGEIGIITRKLSSLNNHKLLKLNSGELINLSSSSLTIYKKDCDFKVKLINKISI